MKKAILLAKKGYGKVNPNPVVGAVIVKDGKIIGKGYHHNYGNKHAEQDAIDSVKDRELLKGAEIYVTLEPCCHYGKRPPCTNFIIESGIKTVFVGSSDPNPLVKGKGIKILRENGIEVFENILKDECDKLNEVFFHFITTKLPYVVMKYAMTADGRIASVSGNSRWISNEKSREYVHKMRNILSGIMVGINTVEKDNPMLTCRIKNGRNPYRIVTDSNLRISFSSNIVKTAKEIPSVIVCTAKTFEENTEKVKKLKELGCNIIFTSSVNGRILLTECLKKLADLGIDGILLEGGGTLNASMLKEKLVNKVQVFIAPKILGGVSSPKGLFLPVLGEGIKDVSDCIKLSHPAIKKFDDDLMLEYDVLY